MQGAILQAPLSDRDALTVFKVHKDAELKVLFEKCMRLITTVPENEHKTHLLPLSWTMPLFGRAPLSVSRFLDLASPSSPENLRQEDFFSHDLLESRLNGTFGQVGARQVLARQTKAAQPSVLILISESDEVASQPATAQDLFQKWEKALASHSDRPVALHSESTCIKDANHDISGSSPAQQKAKLVSFREALLKYLDDVVGGVDEYAFDVIRQSKKKFEQSEKEGATDNKP